MSKCANCNELVGEQWSTNNGLCDPCEMDKATRDNDVLTQMFEEMGVDVIDVTPKEVK